MVLRAVVAILFFLPVPLLAEEIPVTLHEAIRLALVKNNLVRAAEQEKEAARYGVSASRGRYFPRIFLDESFVTANSPTRVFMMKLDQGRFTQNDFLINNLNHPSSTGNFRTAFSLEQPLFDLSIGYGAELARTEAKGRDLALERCQEEVAFQVFSAFVETRKAEAMMEAAEKAVQSAAEHHRLAKTRNKAGMGLKADELRTGAFLAEMEVQAITARNNVRLAGMRLSLATGGTGEEPLRSVGAVTGKRLDRKGEELLTLAKANRKDRLELENEAKKADLTVKMADSAFLPTVAAGATYEMNDRDMPFSRDNDAWFAGVSLRWELFEGLRRVDERKKAFALRASAREYLEQRGKEIAFQVRESMLRQDEAGKKLNVVRAVCQDAEEGVRLITRRYENSLALLVEVLDAQTALNRARVNVVEGESEYAMATAKVWRAAGIFLEEVMQ